MAYIIVTNILYIFARNINMHLMCESALSIDPVCILDNPFGVRSQSKARQRSLTPRLPCLALPWLRTPKGLSNIFDTPSKINAWSGAFGVNC